MEYNPIEHICEFIKDHLNVPYLYIRRVGDERLSVVLKPKDADHVILLVYKTNNGDYVVQLDDDNATAILRKTRFNNFVPLDYNNPDKILQSITGSFSELVITRILTFLNKSFLEMSLSQYIDNMIPNWYESSVKPAAMTYDISPTLKLRVTEVLECDNVLELQFNDNDGTVVIAKNENFTEIEIESVWKEVKGEALEFFNDFKQKLGIKESANMTVATNKSNQVTKVEVPTTDNVKMPVLDLLKLRNYIVKAIQELPSYKNIVELYGPLNIRYRITLRHENRTVSLDVGVEGDTCILRSSEMYANYSFKYSRFGNILMQCNVHKRYPNENVGASLTTDTVNEVLCYLSDKFKKIPLFDYIRPALNKWDGNGNVVKGKYASPKQSYLVIFGNYKSVTIKETQIPEELQFVSMNCNGGEGIIRVAENGEDIEIVVDRTKIEDKDLQSFVDHLVKELNATVITNSTTVPNTKEDEKMENEQSKIDTLLERVTQWVGKLSVACIPGDPIRYVVKGTNVNSSCSISKHEDGVTITSEDKKEYKFSLNKFGSVTLHHDDSVVDEIYGIILNIKYRLDYLYRETPLFTYLFHELFNAQPLGELQKQFTVNLNVDHCNYIISKIDDDKCHLTFDINECPYNFILAKNVNHTGINICHTPESLDISWELKPSLDLFIHKLNLTRATYDEVMGTKDNNEDDAPVIPEEEPTSYPVIIRTNSVVPSKDNLHHLVGEGVHLVEEAYRLDKESITVSDTLSVFTKGDHVCIREHQLQHSRIYLVNSDKLIGGKIIVVLPNVTLPQVFVNLVHRIGVDNLDTERTILEHDAVYSEITNQ